MVSCPEGHVSQAQDYCDVCGSAIEPGTQATDSAPPAAPRACPACGVAATGRFCESCGHDSALPTPAPAAAPTPEQVVWTAVVAADRDFYDRVVAHGGPDTVDFPEYFPERRITLRTNSTLIGRCNRDQGVAPEIDLGIHPVDRGVSTQHAVLRLRAGRLTVTDLGSTNGTSLNDSDDFLANGEETPLASGDRIHVGAWTTITVLRN